MSDPGSLWGWVKTTTGLKGQGTEIGLRILEAETQRGLKPRKLDHNKWARTGCLQPEQWRAKAKKAEALAEAKNSEKIISAGHVSLQGRMETTNLVLKVIGASGVGRPKAESGWVVGSETQRFRDCVQWARP